MIRQRNRPFLFISQVYLPDPAAVGQQLADAAAELVQRGHAVVVITAARGYDDPGVRLPTREKIHGVEVRRVPWSSFGKGSLLKRALGGISFAIQALLTGLAVHRPAAIVVPSSPPVGVAAALVLSLLRRSPLIFWAMDLSPDQLVVLGLLRKGSPWHRWLDRFNRLVLRRASTVVALDRQMATRLNTKTPVDEKLHIIPPWPAEERAEVEHGANPFRDSLGIGNKFAVMYSGNHGRSNPLDTILAAARQLASNDDIRFIFVGGGERKQEVDRLHLSNVISLPYQPLEQLKFTLTAADLHVVTLGDGLGGIVHPCKIYGAMAAARPILYVGPLDSVLADLVHENQIGWVFRHGDVDGVVQLLEKVSRRPDSAKQAGARALALSRSTYSRSILCGRVCALIEEQT